jgi:hypothetical protein
VHAFRKDEIMTVDSCRPPATDSRQLLALAAAKLARKLEEQCWEDDGGRTIARAAPASLGNAPR